MKSQRAGEPRLIKRDWENLCAELGLTPWDGSREGPVGFGAIGPHEIRAGIWTGGQVQPWAQLGLNPSLDLGLALLAQTSGGPGAPSTLPVGDPRLDPFLRLRADEPTRMRSLFARRVCDRLNELIECGAVLRIDDDGIVAEGYGDIAPFLRRSVAILLALGGAIDDARVGVPPPRPFAGERDAWENLADERHLELLHTPLRMVGRLGDLALEVATWRAGAGAHAFEARFGFEVPLDLGLSLEPRSVLQSIATFATGDDVRFGDATFDRTFVARARDPALLHRTLVPEVRAALLGLRERVTHLELRDEGLLLRGTPEAVADAPGVPGLVRRAVVALDLLGASWRRSTGLWAGPYR